MVQLETPELMEDVVQLIKACSKKINPTKVKVAVAYLTRTVVYIVDKSGNKWTSISDNVEFSIMLGKLQDKLHHTLRSLEAAR
ncbi:hypothetical protein P8452_62026 [Trifolium repens]|nr:hypothetical protein P8452_62026 [Trifolium repens]